MRSRYNNELDPDTIVELLSAIIRFQRQEGHFWIKAYNPSTRKSTTRWLKTRWLKPGFRGAQLRGFIDKHFDHWLTFSPIIFSEPERRTRLALPSRCCFQVGYLNGIPRDQQVKHLLPDNHPDDVRIYDGLPCHVSFWHSEPEQPTRGDVLLDVPVPRGIVREALACTPPARLTLDAVKRKHRDAFRRGLGLRGLIEKQPADRSTFLFFIAVRCVEWGLDRDETRVVLEASFSYRSRDDDGKREDLDKLMDKASDRYLRDIIRKADKKGK